MFVKKIRLADIRARIFDAISFFFKRRSHSGDRLPASLRLLFPLARFGLIVVLKFI